MYVVFAAKTLEKLKVTSTTNGNVNGSSNGNANGDGKLQQQPTDENASNGVNCHKEITCENIPSLKNGQLRWFSGVNGIPSFMTWICKSPLMVFHHLFIGWYGLLVITYLRGALGDCVLSFFYIMELSTPFVSLRSILATMNLKNTRLYVVNGLTMLAFFFIFRICIIPYAFYWYASFANVSIIQVGYTFKW